MSLKFTGWHCSIKSNRKTIATGFSPAGPGCSQMAALKAALEQPEAVKLMSSDTDMQYSRIIEVQFLMETEMP